MCARNGSCKGGLDSLNKSDLESLHNISLAPGVRLKVRIETGSHGTRKRLAELHEAVHSFGSKEQRSSIKHEVRFTTSRRNSTDIGEARVLLNNSI